jgi:TPR repeat protein
VKWFQEASNAGNINATFNLATQYRSGNGVIQNDKEALRLYKKAAELNFAPAQNAVGYMYAEGRGAKKDVDIAEEWFYKASDNGLALAGSNRAMLKNSGSFSLITLQIDNHIRNQVLTNKNLNLSRWLEVHHLPIL